MEPDATPSPTPAVAEPPVLPPVVPPPAPPPADPPAPLIFHGKAGEYFRIWIVNTLLTVATGGIFAAWANVRKRRYLRGNIELLGHRFDYVANPRRILVGNLIVGTLFLAYALFGAVYPLVRFGALAIALLLLPWIVMRSLAFNAHNTLYRGMRFRFRQNLSDTIVVFIVKPVLIVISLGWYYPAWVRARRRYVIGNHRLGDAFFSFEGANGPFYAAYLLAGLLVLLAALGGGMLVAAQAESSGAPPTLTQLVPFLALYLPALHVAKHAVYARLFNHVWNHTRLDQHRFEARLNVNRWLLLQVTNAIAIIVSCGLLYPWSVVRSNRYAASCLAFAPAGPIERIGKLATQDGNAVGSGAAELFGLDFGL